MKVDIVETVLCMDTVPFYRLLDAMVGDAIAFDCEAKKRIARILKKHGYKEK